MDRPCVMRDPGLGKTAIERRVWGFLNTRVNIKGSPGTWLETKLTRDKAR